ncbi:PTPRG [Lepeophtheirus salmonis]|uniref:PTPRG n=1 Tax=Lepeophtheirus salmonis TaxID=72036 RepID=A0A7R8CHW0_LEPSM|nr:PTPRG [Lepeophtheirus salmonis]CAF2827038.1 PTPRG [Lepeophtheirus salmonis]
MVVVLLMFIIRLLVQAVPDEPGRPLVMAFTSRSVNLSWTPPLSNHNSYILHYLIHIRIGEEGIWDDNLVFETDFRVTAVNALGRSRPSKESYYMITLREVPSGKPTITAAHNISSTSIVLSWSPPSLTSVHGEFIGYRITYKPRNAHGVAGRLLWEDNTPPTEILLKDPAITRYVIQKLQIFTQYLVSLQIYNPEGLGPSTTVVVMTDEGVPTMPINVTFGEIKNSSVQVHWHEPYAPNGIIQGYRLYYMHQNFTDVRTVRNPSPQMQYLLEGLEPYTNYKLWLKAFTWKNEGMPSESFEMLTDVQGPDFPIITNLTCKDETSIFIQWEHPLQYFKAIDFYYVWYRSEGRWEYEEEIIDMDFEKNKNGGSILIKNLTTNTMYELKVRAVTQSLYNASILYKGLFSEPSKILITRNCDVVRASNILTGERLEDSSSGSPALNLELSAGVIAGGACVSFALILAILAFGLWRKYFNESYYYLDESPSTPAPSLVPDWDIESNTTDASIGSVMIGVSSIGSSSSASSGTTRRTAIPAHMFIQHVDNLHALNDAGFSSEYEMIQAMTSISDYPADSSYLADNKTKNRYHNVVAYDHSRVQLRPLPGQKKGEYVNANYIDGFQKARAYIGTQGPLPSTFDSFWRMIWEQRVRVVVMITNLVEKGRRKCDLYWPTEGCKVYGLIEVAPVREEVMCTYTLRTFKIKHTKIKSGKQRLSERIVLQYHYTTWPDHGTPENPLPVLSFVKKSSAANRDGDGPIVVHCSAGVGRTGAYILIDAMMKQMKAKCELNIVAFLRHIRTQRNYLVQTMEQYVFVHDALAEAVASGETNINISYLSRYISSLQSSFTTDENSVPWQLSDRQFKLATSYRPGESQFTASALKPCNQIKNQNFDYLPIESGRVFLTGKSGIEGSDYVNASWLPGYHNLREFIVTQHPIEQTAPDFWQMLWDHRVQNVVILSSLQQPEFGVFWPTKQVHMDLESNIRVKLTTEDSTETGSSIVQVGHMLALPISSVTDLIRSSSLLKKGGSLNSSSYPWVIVDRFGGTEAASFCAISTLLKQLEAENHVDVYQIAKVYHNRRPGIWRSQSDYLFLYKVIEAVVNSDKHYSTGMSLRVPPEGMESLVCKEGNELISDIPDERTNGECINVPGNNKKVSGGDIQDDMDNERSNAEDSKTSEAIYGEDLRMSGGRS